MKRKLFTYFSAVSLLTGCVPASYIEVPAIRGRVIDPDGLPVPNAEIHVVRDVDVVRVENISTRLDGVFNGHEQSQLTLQIAGADRASHAYSVTAVEGDRRSATIPVRSGVRRWFLRFYDPPLDHDLGDVVVR